MYKTKRVGIYLSEEQHKLIKSVAKHYHRSMTAQMSIMVQEWMEEKKIKFATKS